MAPHSSILAWKIPWTEEPGRLQSMGSLRVGHDWATLLSLSCIGEGNSNPAQCSCLENPRDGGAWWAALSGVAQSQTRLKWLRSSSRGNRDHIANVWWIIEKAKEFQKKHLLLLMNYIIAFDCVNDNNLWKIFQETGIPDHLSCLLINLYVVEEAVVTSRRGTIYWFQIGKGVQ